jgi:hypothetical protein
VPGTPTGAMRLHHLSAMHPTEVGLSRTRMETECLTTVALEAYEVVEEEPSGRGGST